MGPADLSPAVIQWVHGLLGDAPVLRPLDGGTMGRTYRATTRGADVAVIKCVTGQRAWAQEVEALRRFEGLHGSCPRLLGADAASLAILMTWVEGHDVHGDGPDQVEVWRAAGAIRRRFDTVPTVPDAMPLDQAITRRFAGWLTRARAVLPAPLCDDALAHHDPSSFASRARRWCHRDFGPHNWRVDTTAIPLRVGCVDFGHARVDDPLVDLVHATVPPFDSAAMIEAFANGWGIALDPPTWRSIAQLGLLHGLATSTWGQVQGVARFRALGDAILARCFTPGSPWFVGVAQRASAWRISRS